MSLIAISPGHYGVGTGAKDLIDEVTEARKIVDQIASLLQREGIGVSKIVDNRSKSQKENLNYLVKEHNAKNREMDVSIHFNTSNGRTNSPLGTEVLYMNNRLKDYAESVSKAIGEASGLKNRGAKKRTDLAFLRGTNKPAILIEVCFVNSTHDVNLYKKHFQAISEAISKKLIEYVAPDQVKRKQAEVAILKNLPMIYASDPNATFTSSALIQRLETILRDPQMIQNIIQKGIAEQAIHANWNDKVKKQTLTSADFLGLCALILEHQIKNKK